jgi:hypothetical protein
MVKHYSGIGDRLLMGFIYTCMFLAGATILLPVMNVIASSSVHRKRSVWEP